MCSTLSQIRWAVIVFIAFTASNCEDISNITVISNIIYNKTYKSLCVVNGNSDSALAWNEPLPSNDDPKPLVSEYVPQRNSNYKCDINDEEVCRKYWTGRRWNLENSVDGVLGPVTDRRWEEFKIFFTDGTDAFQNFGYINNADFTVHISLRIEKEAHIYLCDDGDPPNAKCYWILLGGFNGEKTGIRKCAKQKVPRTGYAKGVCRNMQDSKNHSPSAPIVNGMEWRHFTIRKKSKTISLWQVGENEPILNYVDDSNQINVNYLSIRSSKTVGYWKLHNYAYTRTNYIGTAKLGEEMYIEESDVCIGMFVAMCDQCSIILNVKYWNPILKNWADRLITIESKKEMTWQQEKIILKLPRTPTWVHLNVESVCATHNCENPFWAIDKFQLCSENEVRVLTLNEDKNKASCQVVKYPYQHVVQTEVQSDNFPEKECSLGKFGKECFSCSAIMGLDKPFCEKSIICDMQSNGHSSCRCAVGYTGSTCETGCNDNTYGFGCNEHCGYCNYLPCLSINGDCIPDNCLSDFTDSRCKTPPFPVLLNPPTVLAVGHTDCTVQIQNNSYEGKGNASNYRIQYRKEKEGWQQSATYDYFNTSPITIKNLNTSTTYIIRAILLTANGDGYYKEYVRTINVTTTCAVVEEKDVVVEVTNTTATIKLKDNPESCSYTHYEVVLMPNRHITSEKYTFFINNLNPATTYDLHIINRIMNKTLKIGFLTEEGAPGPVEELNVINKDTTTIAIGWKPPRVPNGKIKHYDVHYKLLKYIACGDQQGMIQEPSGSFQLRGTGMTISKLRPYSEYSIDVLAVTSLPGVSSNIRVGTLETDMPESSEIPVLKEVKALATTAKVVLEPPNCMEFKGSLEYDVKAECLSEWCSKNAEDITPITNSNLTSISVLRLQAYCNYTLKIKARRKNGNVFNGAEQSKSFTTKTSKPHKVRSITPYSKDENSISFRILPPYPPTGEIDKYYLNYCYTVSTWAGLSSKDACQVQYVIPRQCKLWHTFDCLALQQLESQQLYTITVLAKNKDTDYSNNTQIVQVKTVQEPPSVLENFTSIWDDYYNLTLTWGHPDIANGPLTKFIVTIISHDTVCYKESFPVTVDSYNSTYYNVIPFGKCYSSMLNIRAAAFNIHEGPPAVQNISSPPITPSFSKNPVIEMITNTTITMNIPAPKNLAKNSTMYVIVTTTDVDAEHTNDIVNTPQIQQKLNLSNNTFSWITAEYDFTKIPVLQQTLVIGDDKKSRSSRWNTELYNQILRVSTIYTISILLINAFGGFERYTVYTVERKTGGMMLPMEQIESSNYGWLALLLLLVLPVILYIYIRRKKEKNISWLNMVTTNINFATNNRNPDVIPLATSTENKQKKIITPSQLRPKRKTPTDADANLAQPSTSTVGNKFSKPVKIIEFEKYVKESIESGELERQHQLFPRGQTKPWDYGLLPQNKSKNRYNNLVAYDHTRVKLPKIINDPYSDYINANYIEGYNTKKAYIATQGPKASTVNDFWRMIWQENVNHIIMLANVIEAGKKKTEQYWPNINEYLEFDNIKVEYVSSRVFADYEYRTFLVSCKNEERRVEQLHFTSWPDHAVPLYSQSLVPFLRKMLTIPQGSSPIVVHCSAGVGRTGTIILCDLCLRMAAREGVVDVLKHQYKLREQRANLVDNIEQYKLVHLVLLDCLVAPQTSMCCDEEMEAAILRLLDSEQVAQQMLYLRETAWQDQAMRPPLQVTPVSEWSPKNRFQDIIPSGHGRVYLSRYPVTDEHSDYINAVEVDGFRAPQRFIATQQPLPNTISDFWRMIDEKEVTTIVSLNKINLGDETSCVFWPTAKASEIQPVPFLLVQFHKKTNTDHYSVITIHLQNKKDKNTVKRTVNLIILKGWSAQKMVPDEHECLLKLWAETERLSRGENPIVVTCYDGAKACGLFIALSFIVEKMKLEQECDVCLAVRTVRHNRTQFVAEIEQFLYLYRAAISYLSCFDLYSNFTPAGKK